MINKKPLKKSISSAKKKGLKLKASAKNVSKKTVRKIAASVKKAVSVRRKAAASQARRAVKSVKANFSALTKKLSMKKTKKSSSKNRASIKTMAMPIKKAFAAKVFQKPTNPISPYQRKKDEDYMSDAQLMHFSRLLAHWKDELMAEVDSTIHHMQDDAANFPDPNDRATQEEEFSLELRARDRERKLIKKIDDAMRRIEDKDYGYCDECGVEIGIQRLEARPTATLCIDCKTLDEIKEKQLAS